MEEVQNENVTKEQLKSTCNLMIHEDNIHEDILLNLETFPFLKVGDTVKVSQNNDKTTSVFLTVPSQTPQGNIQVIVYNNGYQTK